MSTIGSIGSLASQAAQLYTRPAAAASAEAPEPVADGDVDAGTPSSNFTGDYAMALLAKITHASADQALTLIQGMSAPVGPDGR